MAKERGLISPSDFAQLQKYMECESSSESFSAETPKNLSSSSLPLPLCPVFQVALSQSAPERCLCLGKGGEGDREMPTSQLPFHLLWTLTTCSKSQRSQVKKGITLELKCFSLCICVFLLEISSFSHLNLLSH